MKLRHRFSILLGSSLALILGASGYAAAQQTYTYGGHTYVLVTTNQYWTDASQDCWARQGALATVNDDGENAFLAGVLSDNDISHAWIGLHDQWSEGYFQWVSGDSSTYRNWGSGEPNDAAPGEDFVELRPGGTWNDLPADWSIPYICELW